MKKKFVQQLFAITAVAMLITGCSKNQDKNATASDTPVTESTVQTQESESEITVTTGNGLENPQIDTTSEYAIVTKESDTTYRLVPNGTLTSETVIQQSITMADYLKQLDNAVKSQGYPGIDEDLCIDMIACICTTENDIANEIMEPNLTVIAASISTLMQSENQSLLDIVFEQAIDGTTAITIETTDHIVKLDTNNKIIWDGNEINLQEELDKIKTEPNTESEAECDTIQTGIESGSIPFLNGYEGDLTENLVSFYNTSVKRVQKSDENTYYIYMDDGSKAQAVKWGTTSVVISDTKSLADICKYEISEDGSITEVEIDTTTETQTNDETENNETEAETQTEQTTE